MRDRIDRDGDGRVRITNLEFLGSDDRATTSFASGQDAAIVISYETQTSEPVRYAHAAVSIETTLGERIGMVSSLFTGDEFPELPPAGRITCRLPALGLNTGEYVITVWITASDRYADQLHDAAVFTVEALDFYGTGRHPDASWGPVLLANRWSLEPTRAQ